MSAAKKINVNRREIRLPNTRVNTKEMNEILRRAWTHDGGELSRYIRRACLNYEGKKNK